MELIRGLHNVREHHRPCVATLGTFDGVHRGHQAVLRQLLQKSDEYNAPALVITSEPHSLEYFRGEDAPARLTRLSEKLELLEAQGVPRVLCLYFNRRLSTMEAETFVHHVFCEKLNVRYFVAGDDLRFGNNRRGDLDMLRQMGEKYDFEVSPTSSFMEGDERISSTRIRELLAQGDLATAETMLGRPYQITGRVIHGDAKGRTIGFPTANILLRRRVTPVSGVFAIKAYTDEHPDAIAGVANVGHRPTVGGVRKQLEVHLFDFSADLYGQRMTVTFCKKLREEQKFESFEALRQQIASDCDAARNALMN
ncbi:MAG: bifunctional riboflavin kinase/FAD synthetase [Pseudomonadota bacterium]